MEWKKFDNKGSRIGLIMGVVGVIFLLLDINNILTLISLILVALPIVISDFILNIFNFIPRSISEVLRYIFILIIPPIYFGLVNVKFNKIKKRSLKWIFVILSLLFYFGVGSILFIIIAVSSMA